MPLEPPTQWSFPDARTAGPDEIVAVGGDLEPGTLVAAYRRGLFPMRVEGLLAWWSPDSRGIMPLDGFHASRSLRRKRARFDIRVDTAFETVMRACAAPERPYGWIDESFITAYTRLYHLGWAHSVETWLDGVLVGGVYGIRIGRFFAGESMFHRVTDASSTTWLYEYHRRNLGEGVGLDPDCVELVGVQHLERLLVDEALDLRGDRRGEPRALAWQDAGDDALHVHRVEQGVRHRVQRSGVLCAKPGRKREQERPHEHRARLRASLDQQRSAADHR